MAMAWTERRKEVGKSRQNLRTDNKENFVTQEGK